MEKSLLSTSLWICIIICKMRVLCQSFLRFSPVKGPQNQELKGLFWKWKKVKVTQSCPILCDPMDYSPWHSPDQNTGAGSLSILQGIFPAQGRNPGLLHCRQILYQLRHKGSPFWKWYSSNPWNHIDNQFRRENATHGPAALSAHPLCCTVLSHSVVSDSLWPHDCSPPGSSVHGDSPGKNIGAGCHALLQGIFPTQGLNPHLPHCRQILYHLSHQGSRSMKWTTCDSV